MSLSRLKSPMNVATLWFALLLAALPAGATQLGGESENYSASARLEDGVLHIAIVNKASGRKVSNRVPTRATKLTEIRVRDSEGKVIVHGKVGSRGDIRFEFFVNDASYFDRILGLRSESENYAISIRLMKADPPEVEYTSWVLDITIFDKVSRTKVSRRTQTSTAKLTELYILEAEQRLIVHGQLGRRGDIVSVVNLKDASVLDTIWGWQASFSPNKTRVVYRFRYPPHAMHRARTAVLLIYDFSATPRQNSFREEDMADPTTRGYVIYPERNRKLGKHFIPAMSEEDKIKFLSPIAWSHGGTQVVLLEGFQENTYLLLADLAKGLEAPEVTRLMLEKESYYKQPIDIYWRKEYEGALIFAKTLRFNKDDQSVIFTTFDHGPFAEQQAVIELD